MCVCVCVCVCLLGPVPHLLGALGCQNCHLQASRFFRSPGLIFGPLLARFPPPAPPVPRDSVEEGGLAGLPGQPPRREEAETREEPDQ